MIPTSLYENLKRRPRETEDSRVVASTWGNAQDAFIAESPNPVPGNEQVRTAYFKLTAERFIYRSKILGLPMNNELSQNKELRSSHPFGINGPTYESLCASNVSIAMAFVPLTGSYGDDRTIMARLYCVGGLKQNSMPPFKEGSESPDIDRFSWFIAGVPSEWMDKSIAGRSWLLAANLLMRIVQRRDLKTARNLATSFVATGDIANGNIAKVEMGNKPKLAEIKEFSNRKWIIPMKNENEMNNVSPRRIEKPATLDEAYALIESMQNKATRSLFRFLKEGNLEGMKEQYDIGADIFAEDEKTHKQTLQLIAEIINEAASDEKKKQNVQSLKMIRKWLEMQGASCATMFYALAKTGSVDALKSLIAKFPINARNEFGETAVDMALLTGDFTSARILHSLGGVCDGSIGKNLLLEGRDWPSEELVEVAIECGLPKRSLYLFAIQHHFFNNPKGREVIISGIKSGEPLNCPVHGADLFEDYYGNPNCCNPYTTDIFGLALDYGYVDIVKVLLENGKTPDTVVRYDYDDRGPHGSFTEYPARELMFGKHERGCASPKERKAIQELFTQFDVKAGREDRN